MKAILSARLTMIDFVYDTLFKLIDWLQERRGKALAKWQEVKNF